VKLFLNFLKFKQLFLRPALERNDNSGFGRCKQT